MKKLSLLLLLIPFLAPAQGVHFEDNLSWTAIQANAIMYVPIQLS